VALRTTTPSILTPQAPLPTTPIKPFDWTYSTLHTGVVRSSSSASTPKPDTISWRPTSESESIPLELLSRPDPILFYDEIPLFESELDDNGSSVLSVRIVRAFFSLTTNT
jgi:type 2A phosphatase activator TIP41